MSKAITTTSVGLLCLATASAFCFLSALAQEPKGGDKKQNDKAELIVGAWESQDRHLAMGTLYQPSHGTRLREGAVYFKLDGDKLTGYSITPKGMGLSGSNSWKDGRTEFRTVTFADGKLVFEFDVKEAAHGFDLSMKEKATIRVEAKLMDGRLIGKWGLFLKDGTEPFRGEWEAVRTEASVLGGPLILIGGRHQDLSNDLRDVFFDLAGGNKAKIVVIPTAVGAGETEPEKLDKLLNPWRELKPLSVQILHTRDRKTADDPAFVRPLTEATAVFFTNGHADRIFNAYRGTLVHKELKKLQARGGLVGGTGTGMSVLGDFVLWHKGPGLEPALGILPGFLSDDPDDERLAAAIAANPAHVGLGIEPGAAVVIRGKDMRVLGKGTIKVHLAKGDKQAATIDTFKSGDQLDLVKLRRAAATRAAK